MNVDPLAVFVQGLISQNKVSSDVEIVQDNCGKLSERARSLVKLSYAGVCRSHRRWDSSSSGTDSSSNNDSLRRKTKKKDIGSSSTKAAAPLTKPSPGRQSFNPSRGCPVIPHRRSSLEAGSDRWSSTGVTGKDLNLPPRDPTERSTLRWALALDDTHIAADSTSRFHYGGFNLDDLEIVSDSDSDSDCDSDDSDWENDDSDDDDDDSTVESSTTFDESDSNDDFSARLVNQKVQPHEWKLPPNTVLPNIQSLIREAANDKNFDIQQHLMASLELSLSSSGANSQVQ